MRPQKQNRQSSSQKTAPARHGQTNSASHTHIPDVAADELSPSDVLKLQRTLGNRAVRSRLNGRHRPATAPQQVQRVEPTGRTPHEWRTALQNARNDMVGSMHDAKDEFQNRQRRALQAFERTMDFAKDQSAAGLILKAELNQLVGALPAPVSTVSQQVVIVADALNQQSQAQGAVNLDTWLERKYDALDTLQDQTQDELQAQMSGMSDINQRIEALVLDSSEEAERDKQQWELAMLNATFDVPATTREIEFALYDEWCYKQGAYFVFHYYQTDRNYPGSTEIGRTDQSHAAFGGEQRWAHGVPTEILDRFQRLGIRPQDALSLPTETVSHGRTAPARGGIPAQYDSGESSYYMPYDDERAQNWSGPSRFRNR